MQTTVVPIKAPLDCRQLERHSFHREDVGGTSSGQGVHQSVEACGREMAARVSRSYEELPVTGGQDYGVRLSFFLRHGICGVC